MGHSTTISPAIRTLYARQRALMDMEYLTAAERAELSDLPDQLEKEWKLERKRRCFALHGAPRTITTGADPRDQAYGDR
jgi:fructoselysine-6-P-deglycase FrlB-like protein